MKFPSLNTIFHTAANTVRRFPFELIFALTGTIAATILIYRDYTRPNDVYTKIIMTANLGMLISLSVSLFLESKAFAKLFFIKAIAAVFACALFFSFGAFFLTGTDYTRFFLLSLSLHLIISFAAFTVNYNINGFWQFNKALFLRILTSVLYSGVLYLGLAAAIAATRFLFNLTFEYKIYSTLFVWIAGIFNTLFFLSGIPANTTGLQSEQSYPKGLKVFTQYVLIPLATVYLVILLAYEVKILFQWHLPKGYVSNLILGYAVFGLLAILLVYPLREQEENKWIKIYARSFYFLLVPLIALLFLAIYSRILPYGVTVPRYFLILLAGWLAFITVYFLLSRKQNIKVIPVSLAILTLLSVYGPQSAFSVSKFSQMRIFTSIFKKYHAFNNGKLISLKKAKVVAAKDGNDAYQKANYFVYGDDFKAFQPYLNVNLDHVIDSIVNKKDTTSDLYKGRNAYLNDYDTKSKEMTWLADYLGLSDLKTDSISIVKGNYYEFGVKNPGLLKVSGSDYVLNFNTATMMIDTAHFKGDSVDLNIDGLRIKQTVDRNYTYNLSVNNDKLSFDVKSLADSLIKNENKLNIYHTYRPGYYTKEFVLPGQLLSVTKVTSHFKVTLQLVTLNCGYAFRKKSTKISEATGYFLIGVFRQGALALPAFKKVKSIPD